MERRYLGPNGTKHYKLFNDDTLRDVLNNKQIRYDTFCTEFDINIPNDDLKDKINNYVNNRYITMKQMHNPDNVMRYCASRRSIPHDIVCCGHLSDLFTEYKNNFGFWYIIEKKKDNLLFKREFENYILNDKKIPWNSDELKNIFNDEIFEEIKPDNISNSDDMDIDSDDLNSDIDHINDLEYYEDSYRYKSGYFEQDNYSTCSSDKSNSLNDIDNCDY